MTTEGKGVSVSKERQCSTGCPGWPGYKDEHQDIFTYYFYEDTYEVYFHLIVLKLQYFEIFQGHTFILWFYSPMNCSHEGEQCKKLYVYFLIGKQHSDTYQLSSKTLGVFLL